MNLRLPIDQVRSRVDETLRLLGLGDLADRAVHQLSYGQRKRVAIAGAVAMRPTVLLLDEPTAGLDPAAVDELATALEVLERHGTTVVLSTHDVDLAWSWADEVAVVVDGAVHHDVVTKVLTDDALLARARLGLPWPVDLLRRLGHEIDPVLPPRSTADVARLLG
jgi:cobalt/nickel transport system ATP-binding protein